MVLFLKLLFIIAIATLTPCGAAKRLTTDPVTKGRRRDIVKSVTKANALKAKIVERCFGDLGCFKTGEPFYHPKWRSDSLPPNDPDKMNLKFLLFTRNRWKVPDIIHINDTEGLKKHNFDGSKPTKIIVHGFTDTGFVPWIESLAYEFLKQEDCNAIGVDWGDAAIIPYTQGVANTRVVGAAISRAIKYMVQFHGLQLDQLHLIGHSLGSHIAGYAAERLNKVGRITGLDPAGPYFQFMPEITRLDISDAMFVDVIHTDSPKPMVYSYGLLQSLGHADYFPNGGQFQPGCERSAISKFIDDGLDNGLRETAACNHARAIDFFTESINSQCLFIGHECGGWEDFVEGRCTSCGKENLGCAILGNKALDTPQRMKRRFVRYYLGTADRSPFCIYHYLIRMVLEDRESFPDEFGELFVTLTGTRGAVSDYRLTKHGPIDLYRGSSYQFLLYARTDIGVISKLELTWTKPYSILNPMTWPIIQRSKLCVRAFEVIPLDVMEEKTRLSQIRVLCSQDYVNIDKPNVFAASDNCKI